MTQVFDADGNASPATILEVEPNIVTRVKTKETDGYDAVQVATGVQKEQRVAKAQKGQNAAYKHTKEFRPSLVKKETMEGIEQGASIDASTFAPGDEVIVSAISKGKGFQGGVKRYGFKGGPKTHGNKHHERAPGSIGAGGNGRVFKGTRMAGRMGADRITVKNLQVLQVNKDKNILLIKGAIPGRKGALVEVRGV